MRVRKPKVVTPLAKELKDLRLKAGLSRVELWKMVGFGGTPGSRVASIESEHCRPSATEEAAWRRSCYVETAGLAIRIR
jgi:hypothetical protein